MINNDYLSNSLTVHHIIPSFNKPEEKSFWKHSGKGKNAGNQYFLLFLPDYLLNQRQISLLNPFPNDKFQTLPN